MKEILTKKLAELETSQQVYVKQKANAEEQLILHKGAIQTTKQLLAEYEAKEMADKESLFRSQRPLPDSTKAITEVSVQLKQQNGEK